MALRDWEHADRRWALDVERGSLVEDGDGVPHGFVVRGEDAGAAGWEFAAAYADGGALWLQVGAKRWQITSINVEHVVIADGSRCLAMVRRGPEEVLTVPYRNPLADDTALLDPTFDATDAELADFFLWLSRCLHRSGWTESILPIWEAGLR